MLRVIVVQDFDFVSIKDGDNGTGEVGSSGGSEKPNSNEAQSSRMIMLRLAA